jgi:hypothetical protein
MTLQTIWYIREKFGVVKGSHNTTRLADLSSEFTIQTLYSSQMNINAAVDSR